MSHRLAIPFFTQMDFKDDLSVYSGRRKSPQRTRFGAQSPKPMLQNGFLKSFERSGAERTTRDEHRGLKIVAMSLVMDSH